MAAGQFVTIKLMRSSPESPWGFRLQGGREFQLPLSVIKVAPGSLSEHAGLQPSDIIAKINGHETETMRHKEAQDAIRDAGNYLELYIERGALNTWRPSVAPVGDVHARGGQVYTKTSLEKSTQQTSNIGSEHNTTAKPFNGPTLVHKQYNSPVNLYSEKNLEETLAAHTQVLATGATGINFMRPDAPVNKESAVYQMVRDEEMQKSKGYSSSPDLKPVAGFQEKSPIKSVSAPVEKAGAGAGAADGNKNICAECERLIVGVFVRINNKSLHAECFRCTTCGSSLKNVGYFNVNDKLYCDVHARQVKSFLGVGNCGAPLPVGPGPVLSATIAAPPPTVGTNTNVSNGYHSNVSSSYQQQQQQQQQQISSTTQQNGSSFAAMKKYSPVSPPTGPKPFNSSRNSMYMSTPAPFMSETIQSTTNRHTDWPAGNVVTYREKSQTISCRPKSCYSNLPIASPPNIDISQINANQNDNANGLYSNTANFASSSMQSQSVYAPPPIAAVGPAALAVAATNYNKSNTWGGSNASGSLNKSTFANAPATPKRGRGQLQTQLTGGVIPFCGYCSQPIRGQYIMALNKTWCPAHFICANTLCKKSLEEHGFVEEQGRLYCESCFDTHFAPNCAKCGERIKGDCLNALDRQWHPNCFTCAYCRVAFGNSSFYMEDGLPYCEKDWNELFTTKCVGCALPIAAGDRWVEALNQNYHSNCFRCTVCKANLEGQSFFAKGGKPFCRAHAR